MSPAIALRRRSELPAAMAFVRSEVLVDQPGGTDAAVNDPHERPELHPQHLDHSIERFHRAGAIDQRQVKRKFDSM